MGQNKGFLSTVLLPGIFFILPCIENYSKVDLRTSVIDIPPQEVNSIIFPPFYRTFNDLIEK
jgi:regulator of protease activity HflC (stomatin/prohibitin superfamily)